MRKVLSVSHEELQHREAEWKRKRKAKKRAKTSPASPEQRRYLHAYANDLASFLLPLAVGVCFSLAPIGSQAQSTGQKQTTPQQAPHRSATTKSNKYFGFGMRSVEPEKMPDGSNGPFYMVEGTTINGWRFALSCPNNPPYSTRKYYTVEEQAERDKEYRDIEQFRKLAFYSISLASLKNEAKFEEMTLYSPLRLPRVDERELRRRAAEGDETASKIIESLDERRMQLLEEEPEWEAIAECVVINRIENASELLSVAITSSRFGRFNDGQGYEAHATIGNESLTLRCVERVKGNVCQSIPPGQYRAIRIGSQLRLYDSILGLVGSYRILSEQSSN